jgi:hypothetical protein
MKNLGILLLTLITYNQFSAQSEIIAGYNKISFRKNPNERDFHTQYFPYYIGYSNKISKNKGIYIGVQTSFGWGDYLDLDLSSMKYKDKRVKRFALINNFYFRTNISNPERRISFFYAIGVSHVFAPQTIYRDKLKFSNRIYANIFGFRNQFGLKINLNPSIFLTTSYSIDIFPKQSNLDNYYKYIYSRYATPLIGIGFNIK